MRERGAERGHRHFFYGGSPRVVETLVLRLKQRFPGLVVAGYRSPPFRSPTQGEDAADVRATSETRLDFVWVGLGTPTQDKWMAQHVGKIHAAALLGVGAAFDQLFRLMTVPRRLAPHYFVVNSIFVARALQQLAGWKSYARDW
jgi:N-acetylglucosaminyldiphosphoundecaprenol N-acetyl-beta-D-mannosaminyltransferase